MMTPGHKDKSQVSNQTKDGNNAGAGTGDSLECHKYVDPRLSRVPQVKQQSVLWTSKYAETISKYETFEDGLSVHPMSKAEIKRQETIFELVWSEKTYVEDLKTITDVFVKPFKAYESVVSSAERKVIFGNVTEIYDFNSLLYSTLSKHQQEDGRF